MLCERCNKSIANVRFIKVINGAKQEFNICEKCAKEQDSLNFVNDKNIDAPLYFQNLISGLIDYMNKPAKDVRVAEVKCSKCGMTYSEFKKKGLMGCSNCYKEFKETVIPIVKRVQGGVEHIGKVPKNAGRGLIDRKKLVRLKEELQKSILEEEYERAAELRDEIKFIQKNIE